MSDAWLARRAGTSTPKLPFLLLSMYLNGSNHKLDNHIYVTRPQRDERARDRRWMFYLHFRLAQMNFIVWYGTHSERWRSCSHHQISFLHQRSYSIYLQIRTWYGIVPCILSQASQRMAAYFWYMFLSTIPSCQQILRTFRLLDLPISSATVCQHSSTPYFHSVTQYRQYHEQHRFFEGS